MTQFPRVDDGRPLEMRWGKLCYDLWVCGRRYGRSLSFLFEATSSFTVARVYPAPLESFLWAWVPEGSGEWPWNHSCGHAPTGWAACSCPPFKAQVTSASRE